MLSDVRLTRYSKRDGSAKIFINSSTGSDAARFLSLGVCQLCVAVFNPQRRDAEKELKSVLLILASYSVVAAQNETGTVKLEGQVVCCQDCWAKADRTIVAYGAGAE
jgi:hypothetical protein